MSKESKISVTVAAGCHVTVPHPSGIRELPSKVLSGGAVFNVTPETATDLWAARLILDPKTGAAPPLSPAAPRLHQPSGVSVNIGGGPRVIGGMVSIDQGIDWAAFAAAPSSEDRVPKPPPHNCLGPVIDRTRDTGW